MKNINKYIIFLIISSFMRSDVRLKDIIQIENESNESLIGYGLVIGLGGTGDRSS